MVILLTTAPLALYTKGKHSVCPVCNNNTILQLITYLLCIHTMMLVPCSYLLLYCELPTYMNCFTYMYCLTVNYLLIVSVIYTICEEWDLDFFSMYAAVGLWNSLFVIIYSVTGASRLMKWSTRLATKGLTLLSYVMLQSVFLPRSTSFLTQQ